MRVVIPLAGPDLYHAGELRPLFPVNGTPLIKRVVESREWGNSGLVSLKDLFFIVREMPEIQMLTRRLTDWFPGSNIAVLPHVTYGAPFSVLAGLANALPYRGPICIDLADIIFDSVPVHSAFDGDYSAVVPYFQSDRANFSYLLTDQDDRVLFAREKEVITRKASAGVYAFKSGQILLGAIANSLPLGDLFSVKGAHFMCPLINMVIGNGGLVKALPVRNVVPVSSLFNTSPNDSMEDL